MHTKGNALRRRLAGVAALLVMAAGMIVVDSGAAFASSLTKVSWAVSNSQTGKTSVTYSYAFQTATTATLDAVTMTVPSGTGGTVGVGTVYGLGAGTASLAGTTLTYTVTSPISVAANIPIYVSFTGLTNTSTAGSYTSTITTQKGAALTVDTATSGSVTFGSSSTGVTVTVGQTLTFTNSAPSLSLAVDPSMLDNNQTEAVTLSIQTNAASGYTLAVSDTGLSRSAPSFTIPAVSSGPATGVASFPTSGWGASATLTTGGTDGATLAAGLSAGKWVGYPSSAANLLTATGPTGATADTVTVTDQVAVDYTVPAGTYNDTITYTATPSY
jgi:hypothetical protein